MKETKEQQLERRISEIEQRMDAVSDQYAASTGHPFDAILNELNKQRRAEVNC